MKNFKKMILVPADTKVDSQRLLQPTNERKLVQLDNDMRNILSRNDLSKDRKLMLYNRILQDYINLHSKLSRSSKAVNVSHLDQSELGTTDTSDFDFSPHQVLSNNNFNSDLSSRTSFDSLPEDDLAFRTSTPIESTSISHQLPSRPNNYDSGVTTPPMYPRPHQELPNRNFQKPLTPNLSTSANDEEVLNTIIHNITRKPNILSYDKDTHEIIYRGKQIPNTNINDIIAHHLYGTQMLDLYNYHVPEGSDVFNAALNEVVDDTDDNQKENSQINQLATATRQGPTHRNILQKRSHTNSLALMRSRKLLKPSRKRKNKWEQSAELIRKKLLLHHRNKRKFDEFRPAARFFPNKKQKIFDVRNKRKFDDFKPNVEYFPNKKQKFSDARYIRNVETLRDLKRKWIKI